MHPFLNFKVVNLIPPVAIVDDASWTTTEIDTLGWDHLTLLINLGASDIAIAAMAATESDTAGSGHANITGLVASGTTGDGRLPTATDDGGVVMMDIDLRGRKRYIDLTLTAGDGALGTFASGVAILSRGKTAPNTTAERGLIGFFRA